MDNSVGIPVIKTAGRSNGIVAIVRVAVGY
jgi:hypothetical protein